MEPASSRGSPWLQAPVRPRYFNGRLLTADDLAKEQEYHIAARRRLTLLTIGSGVAEGLRISKSGKNGSVSVAPGVAIDRFGREVIVPAPVELCVDATQRGGAFVVLRYAEELIEPMPVMGSMAGMEHGAVRETYRLSVQTDRPAPDDEGGAVVIGRVSPRRKARKKSSGRR